MTSILHHFRLFPALAFLGCALAHAAPVPDSTFGPNGSVRIGVPSGYEDTAYTSAIQPDGKVIVAGTSLGRQTLAFVTRFGTDGAPDAGFGVNGAALLAPPPGFFWTTPIQLDIQSDGSVLAVGILYNGFVITRLSAGGVLDTGFGTGGMVVVGDTDAFRGSDSVAAIRVATQPDGKVLVVTDASANGVFMLRFRRFLPQGTPDPAFGPNGTRLLDNLPPNFAFGTSTLAVAEPAGGFTLAARASFQGGTYLLLRVTGNGTLDTTFGGAGYVSGYDLGNPRDVPVQLVRTVSGRYFLFGYPLTESNNLTGTDAVWEVGADGRPVAGFGTAGRLVIASLNAAPRALVPLPDGSIATVQFYGDPKIRVSRFDPNGNPVTQFGTGGFTTITLTGEQAFLPVGIHADASGRLTVTGWGYARLIFSGTQAIPKGLDILLASVTPDGLVRADYGRGDGIAVWNNPAYSGDRIDALRFDTSGRIILVGYSDGSGVNDYLLSRLNANGTLDSTYGTGGRFSPQQSARFTGPARAALQPGGAMVVAGGEAYGSFGTIRAVTAFRASANGAPDSTFGSSFLPAGPNAAVGLGVRPDGRLLYGTNDPGKSYVVQQFLPDGSPDPGFGSNGRVDFPTDENSSAIQGDLVVLGDGSVVFASFSAQSIRLYKVDATGAPVQAFGTGGVLVYPAPEISINFPVGPRLLALADGTLLAANAATGATPASPSVAQQTLRVLRVSADGRLLGASNLLPDAANVNWALTALPDSSVLIARNHGDGASLHRLLPDSQFDAAFGTATGFALSAFKSVSALGIDANGDLLIAGVDPAGALVARYKLDAAVAGVAVVEYLNVNLGHYFMTANAAEMASIESGGAGPGWQRTGSGFHVYVPEAGVAVGARPVCRFYGTPGVGPNSHFYTADAGECAAVNRDRGWTYEGTAFYVLPATGQQCADAAPPVFRAYNNRYAQNDSNHRYATDRSLLQALQPLGWTLEGTVFCAAPG